MFCFARESLRQGLMAGVITISASVSYSAPPAEAIPAAEQIPLVTVQVERNGRQVSGSFTIKATIANTLPAPIFLRQIKTIVPSALNRNAGTDAKPEAWALIPFDKAQLAPGQKRVVRIEVPKASAVDPQMLFFIASKLETGITLSYDTESLQDVTRELDSTITVDWEGSVWGKLAGGIIGCLVLAVFLTARHLRETAPVPAEGANAYRSTFAFFLSAFLFGVATVAAAILLVAFLAPGSLPITFSVEDWRGGALLGLFSVSIGRWLIDKLATEGESQRPAEAVGEKSAKDKQ